MDHAVVAVIPPAPAASSIASSSAASTGALNSHCETASTSGAANTHAAGSHAPQRSRGCQWNDPCSWAIFDLCSSSIQIILLVVFLSIFRHEHHRALQVWAILYGAGWLLMLPLLYCNFKRLREQANQLPQVSPSSQVDESQSSQTRRHQRKFCKWLWRSLNAFFILWFVIGTGIVDTSWAKREAPHLNKLCRLFLIFIYFRFVLPCIFYIVQQCFQRYPPPRGARASVIKALPTYKFHICKTIGQASNKEQEDNDNNDVKRVSIEGGYPRVSGIQTTTTHQVVECCICLDPYEDGVELKELPACTHNFHVQCIDRWLKINGSCPICKNKVRRISRKASTMEPTFIVETI